MRRFGLKKRPGQREKAARGNKPTGADRAGDERTNQDALPSDLHRVESAFVKL
jgi:hypothetical protein